MPLRAGAHVNAVQIACGVINGTSISLNSAGYRCRAGIAVWQGTAVMRAAVDDPRQETRDRSHVRCDFGWKYKERLYMTIYISTVLIVESI